MDLQASDTLDKVLDDATILWQYRTDNSVNVSPTVADGVVYALPTKATCTPWTRRLENSCGVSRLQATCPRRP